MKTFGTIVISFFVINCIAVTSNIDIKLYLADSLNIEFLDITDSLSMYEFDSIKRFILNNGDKEDFSVMYSNNPHYSFNGFEAYLNPEIGQGNSNCDPELSDFNEIVLRDLDALPQYYYIHIVRSGDLNNNNIFTYEGMEEDKVYLLNLYNEDINLLENNLYKLLEIIKKEILLTNNINFKETHNKIKLYPNPVKDIINIKTNLSHISGCKLYNSNGQLIKPFDINNGLNTIDISDLRSGLYFIHIQTQNDMVVKKIVKL